MPSEVITFEVPPNAKQVILKFQPGESGRELVAEEQTEVALLRQQLAEAQAKIQELVDDGERVLQGGRRAIKVPSGIKLVPFSTVTTHPTWILKKAKLAYGERLSRSTEARGDGNFRWIVVNGEFVWQDFPESVFVYKPSRFVTKKGKVVDHNALGFLKHKPQLVCLTGAIWVRTPAIPRWVCRQCLRMNSRRFRAR